MPDEMQTQQGDVVQEWARRALLFDFYSSLLTEKQCCVWDSYYQKDYSLTEIAQEQCTSRQAVHSLLQRTLEILEMYEAKLGLIRRYFLGRDYLFQADRWLLALLESHSRQTELCHRDWPGRSGRSDEIGPSSIADQPDVTGWPGIGDGEEEPTTQELRTIAQISTIRTLIQQALDTY